MQTSRPEPAPTRRLRALGSVALAVALLAVAALGWARLEPEPRPGLSVSAGRAEAIVRRTEVAFADAEAVWRRSLRGSGAYDAARITFFSRATASPCAGGANVSGPFYCAETGTAAFDLAFLDGFGARLDRERDLGLSLYAARVSAEHFQRELGLLDAAALEFIGSGRRQRRAISTKLALQADCLTGAWAAAASPRIGAVPDDFYARMVWSARNLVADLAANGVRVPPEFDAFAAALQADRAAAFARGYAAGAPAACVGPSPG